MGEVAGSAAIPGSTLGDYRIESVLGRGGMAVVYRAVDGRLQRPVALKVLAADLARDEIFRKRFLRESRLAASLDHPNVVPVYDAGEADGALYIAMRVVEGSDLRDVLEETGQLDVERAVAILEQVAAALDAAHRRGLVHRDVKPENVLIGEGGHVYLTDFGLSALRGNLSRLTPTGQLLGTVDYVAPEQIEGREADLAAADVYAFGCLLIECLTGETPYPRNSPLAILWAHVQDEPPNLSDLRPGLPAALDAVAARAIAKEPSARFETCGKVVAAVRDVLEGTARAPAVPVAEETRRVVTVLAGAVAVGSRRRHRRLDPEAVRRIARRSLAEMTAAVERHGGLVGQVAGNWLLAVFGLPAAREDDAVRAARAAFELREHVAQVAAAEALDLEIDVTVRVGIEAGEVVAGSADATAVSGAPVEAAVALEHAAQAGEVLLGADVHALLRGAAVVDQSTERKGALRLVELRAEPQAEAIEMPLLGRERELARVRSVYEEAVDHGRCRVVALLGPAGIGKTRLARELASSLAQSALVLRGRCLSYGEGITYWPVRELVRAAAGDDTEIALQRLLDDETDGALVAQRVAGAIGLRQATWSGEEIFWAVRRLFETLARRRPLVLVIEDFHWAEPTLLDLIEHIAIHARSAPILVLALARTDLVEERPDFLQRTAATTVELEPLDVADAELLLRHRSGERALPPDVFASIVRTAEGNPLFIEQLLAIAAEDPGDARRMSLPPAIHAVLAARLDRLAPEERRILECAAVEGVVFHVGPLAQLCPEIDPMALGRHLLGLSRKQLVQPDRATMRGEEALRFHHGLIREAAYESLTHERRAALHERFASVLERAAGDTSFEEAEFIGFHLEQAVRSRTEAGAGAVAGAELAQRAATHLATAGRGALGRGDFRAAAALLERAAALLPLENPVRAVIELDLSAALLGAGRLAEAEGVAGAVEQRMAVDRRIAANACVQRLLVRYFVDLASAMAELRHRGDDLRHVLEAESDDRGLYRLWHLCGLAHWAEGLVGRATEAWERAAAHAEREGDRVAHVDLLCWLASAAFFGPTPVQTGVEWCEAALEQVRDQSYGRARVLHPLAGLHAMAGRFEVAYALLEEANAILGELGHTMQFAVSHPEALVAILDGDLERAEKRLREGFDLLETMGERGLLSTTAALLARVALDRGCFDDALRYAEYSEETSAPQDASTQAIWRGVKARVLARRGATEEAERLAREAVAIVHGTDHLSTQGDALCDLTDVLVLAGRVESALETGHEAVGRYERKGDRVSARRMRGYMEALSGR